MGPVGVAAAAAEATEECHILKTPDLDLVAAAAAAEVEITFTSKFNAGHNYILVPVDKAVYG